MMLRPVLVTPPPTNQPILSLAEAKAHLRVDHADEDTLITSLVAAAASYLDGYSGILGRALVVQSWAQDFDAFADEMRLPLGDLIAVTSVTYFDAANATQTLASTVYEGRSDERGPFIGLKADQAWPDTYDRAGAVRVTWTAGYGQTAAAVPEAIKAAAKLMIGAWYDNRAAGDIPPAAGALLAPFRRNTI
jgi:uncharacterized phiE125 gp8 family phage protein